MTYIIRTTPPAISSSFIFSITAISSCTLLYVLTNYMINYESYVTSVHLRDHIQCFLTLRNYIN